MMPNMIARNPVSIGPEGTATLPEARGAHDDLAYLFGLPSVSVINYGAYLDGIHDDTPAFNAAAADLIVKHGSGIVRVGHGKARINLVINYPGVIFEGVGWGENVGEGYPTADYWMPHDPTKPVVQVGDDTIIIEGSGIRNARLWGNGTGQYGLIFGGGSVRCTGDYVHSSGFTKIQIGTIGGNSFISVHNRISNFCAKARVVGAAAVALRDFSNNYSVFSNDNFLSNGYVSASLGAAAFDLDGSWAFASNIKVDCGTGGVIGKKTSSTSLKTRLYCANVDIDALSSDTAIIWIGRNSWSTSAGLYNPLSGNYMLDGRMMVSPTQTTGTISAGSTSLVVADATGAAGDGEAVVMSPSGAFRSQIVSVSGTTVTLATPAPSAVSGAVVYLGDRVPQPMAAGQYTASLVGSRIGLYDPNASGYGPPSQQPAIVGGAGVSGAPAPYNSYGLILEMANRPFSLLCNVYTDVTPTSVSRSGSTVTVAASLGMAQVGDLVVVRGAQNAGINGTYPVNSVAGDGQSLTYASPVSADLASDPGAMKIWVVREVFKVIGRNIIMSGLMNYTSDAAAASGGVNVGGLYRNGSALQVRVS